MMLLIACIPEKLSCANFFVFPKRKQLWFEVDFATLICKCIAATVSDECEHVTKELSI